MATTSQICDFGWKAPAFELPGVDGKIHRLEDLKGERGIVVVFICNHCPYVKAVIDRLVADARELEALGVSTVAICSNDAAAYPEDGFKKMKLFADKHGLGFPYLHDESQEVARVYDAVCTPDFFGFNGDLELRYRGRLDSSNKPGPSLGLKRELLEAMKQVAATGSGPSEQTPSMGCSIKWRAA